MTVPPEIRQPPDDPGTGRAWRTPGWWRRSGAAGFLCVVCALAVAALELPVAGKVPGWLGPVVGGLAWALAGVAALTLPAGGFLVAGLWILYAGAVLWSGLAGTGWIFLPVLWLVMLAAAKAGGLVVPGRQRGIFRLAVATGCGVAGWIAATTSGFPVLAAGWMGTAACAGGIGGLGLGAARIFRAKGQGTWMPLAGLVLAGVLTGRSLLGDAGAAAGWAAEFLRHGRSAGALAWLWAGGAAGLLLVRAGERVTDSAMRPFSPERRAWMLPAVWVLATVAEALSMRFFFARTGPVHAFWHVGAWGHVWAGVAAVVMGAGFLWQGRDGLPFIPRLHALWLAAGLALPLLAPVIAGLPAAPLGVEALAAGWSAVCLLLLALIQDVPRLLRSWRDGPVPDVRAAAARLALGGMLAVGFALAHRDWLGNGAGVAALLGMLHLALPRVCYSWWTGRDGAGPSADFSPLLQVWILALGILLALPVLHHDPHSISMLAFAPVLWVAPLLWLRWRRPSLDGAAGAMAGALLAGGTLAAWLVPGLFLPEVPLIPAFNPPQEVSGLRWALEVRPLLQSPHFGLLLVLQAAGALLGALLFRKRPHGEIPVAFHQAVS